jgi:hypothetical protein
MHSKTEAQSQLTHTRRAFLSTALKSSIALTFTSPTCDVLHDIDTPITPKLSGVAAVRLPGNFVGLGYEMSSVATPGLLSVSNRPYVELIHGLGPQGVLRVGGIVADYTRYEPNGIPRTERQDTVITRASLEQFSGFLQRIGWTAIWSVNFAQGSLEEAIAEARAVADVLGPRLLALEIGNEVENYSRGEKPFRKPPYDYESYREEFNRWRTAILKAVPRMNFAAPDTAASVEWVERMATDAESNVRLLTTHYYRENQKRGSAEQLLYPDQRLTEVLMRMRSVSRKCGIPWRMCETNSFSGGGRPGVSDTFVGALWTLDYMLLLAEYGCAGVNIETGINQLGFMSLYSPVFTEGGDEGTMKAGPSYYGMLAFAVAARSCTEVLPLDVDAHGIDMTAYALGAGGKPRSVVVVNKDRSQDALLSVKELGIIEGSVFRLVAPEAESKNAITFAGSAVDADGAWRAVLRESIRGREVTVTRMSAVVVCSVDHPHA